MAYFQTLSQHLHRGNEENQERIQSGVELSPTLNACQPLYH
jgi:hypothetical protein